MVVNSRVKNKTCLKCKQQQRETNRPIHKKCRICGEKECTRKICKSLKGQFLAKLTDYFGLPKACLGTKDIFLELDKIRNIIFDKYINLYLNYQKLFNKKIPSIYFEGIFVLFNFFKINILNFITFIGFLRNILILCLLFRIDSS